MKINSKIHNALVSIRKARQILKEEGVLSSEKALHCELAEWLLAMHLNGTRALKNNQKGWDIILLDQTKIQVKSHAKAETNPSDWTTLSKDLTGVSWIYIIVFSNDFFINEIFKISVVDALEISNKKRQISWPKLRKNGYGIEIGLIKNEFPQLFK